MFISLICFLHLQVMFNYEMDLSSYFTCLHVLGLLLFIAAIITYGICLSYMLVLFGIRIFNLVKYIGSMSLIPLNLQQKRPLLALLSLLARAATGDGQGCCAAAVFFFAPVAVPRCVPTTAGPGLRQANLSSATS
jgi:hypothetical protein